MKKPATKRTRTSIRREDLSKVNGGLTFAQLRAEFMNPAGFAPVEPPDGPKRPSYGGSSGLFG